MLRTMLASIATQVAMVSVFVAAPMFRGGRLDVPALAERFGHSDAHSQMDVIQVFGGAGLRSGEVIDSKYCYDFERPADREFVLDYIRGAKPRIVTVEPMCTLWCPDARLNDRTPVAPRAAGPPPERSRLPEPRGDDLQGAARSRVPCGLGEPGVLAEPQRRHIAAMPGVMEVRLNMCGYGMSHTKGPLAEKPMRPLVKHQAIVRRVCRRC